MNQIGLPVRTRLADVLLALPESLTVVRDGGDGNLWPLSPAESGAQIVSALAGGRASVFLRLSEVVSLIDLLEKMLLARFEERVNHSENESKPIEQRAQAAEAEADEYRSPGQCGQQ